MLLSYSVSFLYLLCHTSLSYLFQAQKCVKYVAFEHPCYGIEPLATGTLVCLHLFMTGELFQYSFGK